MQSFKTYYLREMPTIIGYSKHGITDNLPFNRDDTKVLGSFKGHNIHHLTQNFRGTTVSHDFWAVDQKTNKVNMKVSGHRGDNNNHFSVNSLSGRKDSPIKAHELYHHLITQHSFTITSDKNQSTGGVNTWKHLSKHKDIDMTHNNSYGDKLPLHSADKWHHNYSNESENSRFTAKKKE